jgi:hypothetical protein
MCKPGDAAHARPVHGGGHLYQPQDISVLEVTVSVSTSQLDLWSRSLALLDTEALEDSPGVGKDVTIPEDFLV